MVWFQWIFSLFIICSFLFSIANPIIFRKNNRIVWIFPCVLILLEIILAIYLLSKGIRLFPLEDSDAYLSGFTIAIDIAFVIANPILIATSIISVLIAKLIKNINKKRFEKSLNFDQ